MHILKVISIRTMFLLIVLSTIITVQPVICFGIEDDPSKPLSKKEISERLFKWWIEEAATYSESRIHERSKNNISWMGKFDKKEKKDILAFIDKSEFALFPFFKILKMDLENDGNFDYLMSQLFVKNPQPNHYGSAFVILTRKKGMFHLEILSLSTYPATRKGALFTVKDLDRDGFKEVIIGWEDILSETDSSPILLENIVYKKEDGFWRPIYERATYNYLKIVDLDDNGMPEILETVDDSKEVINPLYTKWRWINVYNLIGSRIEKTNHQYLGFYNEKKPCIGGN